MNDPLFDLFLRLPKYWQAFIIMLFPLKAVMDLVMDNPDYTVSAVGGCHDIYDVLKNIWMDLTTFIS